MHLMSRLVFVMAIIAAPYIAAAQTQTAPAPAPAPAQGPAAGVSSAPDAKATSPAATSKVADGTVKQTPATDPDGSEAAKGFKAATTAMSGFLLFAFGGAVWNLRAQGSWRLSDALSEEPAAAQPAQPPAGAAAPAAPAAPTPLVLVASSSRLIAFLGMLALIGVTIGIGYCVVWAFFFNKDLLSQLDKVGSFLTSAAVIFVPYAANQIKTAIASLGGKPNS